MFCDLECTCFNDACDKLLVRGLSIAPLRHRACPTCPANHVPKHCKFMGFLGFWGGTTQKHCNFTGVLGFLGFTPPLKHTLKLPPCPRACGGVSRGKWVGWGEGLAGKSCFLTGGNPKNPNNLSKYSFLVVVNPTNPKNPSIYSVWACTDQTSQTPGNGACENTHAPPPPPAW